MSTSDRVGVLEALNHQSQLLAATVVLFEQAIADQLHLSVLHIHCANLLRLTGPMTAGQLAELTGLTTGAVTAMIDRLERVGFVRRESDPTDRRRVIVHANGEAMGQHVGALYGSLAHGSEALLARYNDEELATLADYLTRNNALMLDEAVKLRRSAGSPADATSGLELSGEQVSVPLGTVQEGHLVFTTAATRLTVSGDGTQDDLFRAHFGKFPPSVFVQDGLVKMFYRHALLNWSAGTADVLLNGRIPWHIDVTSSGTACTADLRTVPLIALDVNGNASNIDLTVPRPTMHVPCRLTGATSNVIMRCPPNTAMQIRLRQGGSRLFVDGQEIGDADSKPFRTGGFAQATERYEIDVAARLTTLTIETYMGEPEQVSGSTATS